MSCAICLYTDIADWEKDGNTERLKPVLWCEKYNKLCSDVTDCKYKTEKEEILEDIDTSKLLVLASIF